MPELPEIEILKKSLIKNIKLTQIKKVKVNNANLRYKVPKYFVKKLKNEKINKISRISKYLIFHFKSKKKLLIHLGMSGTIHLVKKNNKTRTNLSFYKNFDLPIKHNHIVFYLNNGFKLIYNDPRRFGFFKLLTKDFLNEKPFNKLGPDPLSVRFNYKYINNYIKNKKKNIKNLLMDQNFVSGIGNIYANEILFHCKLNPTKNASYLNNTNVLSLIQNTRKVLKEAILFGGSTIRDFKKIDGKPGEFQQNFKVYDKEKNKCPKIKCNSFIKRIIIANRSSFFCPNCQKK